MHDVAGQRTGDFHDSSSEQFSCRHTTLSDEPFPGDYDVMQAQETDVLYKNECFAVCIPSFKTSTFRQPVIMPDDMKKLSDFKPLRQVTLPGLGDLECSGLIVLVGPNSSGKSQLLQDIYGRISGTPRPLVVASDIQIEKPPLDPFLRCLEDEGYFITFEDESGTKHMRPLTMYLGTGQALGQIQPHQAQNWYGSFRTRDPAVRSSAERVSEPFRSPVGYCALP